MRGLVEHIAIQDIFCSGLGAIERLDGNLLRLWFYASQTGESGTQEKVLVAKLVISTANVPDVILKSWGITADCNTTIVPALTEMMN
jgi:hypothetical protein